MKFSIAGTGNIAFHLSKMLTSHGHSLLQVYARNIGDAEAFAKSYSCEAIDAVNQLSSENDLVVLAVNDDAIAELSNLMDAELFVVHTSGTVNMSALGQKNRGVVWPVKSLRKGQSSDYSNLPMLIESNDEKHLTQLMEWFGKISSKVFSADSDARSKAHLAAVFANNFSNQLYAISEQLLKESNLPFEILLPMIAEHTAKLATHSPEILQTGPARRADLVTIQKQIQQLEKNPEFKEIYKIFTDRILQHYHGKKL